jgi:hypothetical protein
MTSLTIKWAGKEYEVGFTLYVRVHLIHNLFQEAPAVYV